MRALPAHRATSAHLQVAYPFVAGGRTGAGGPALGLDLRGGTFCFDPWERYAAGELTGPNMVVIGQIGRGKSSFVKCFVWRSAAFGRKAWILDPKGEYGPLAEACGTAPIRLAPGGTARLNPLDVAPGDLRAMAGPGGAGPAGAGRGGSELLAAVAAASLGRVLAPPERSALDLAVAAVWRTHAGRGGPCIGAVVAAMLDPDLESARAIRTDRDGLHADGRLVALELRRLVDGDLRGMFDGPTSHGIGPDAPVVVLDLSALYRSPALGIAMICATAWLHGALGAGDGSKRLVVVDESWAVLRDLATARWLQSSFKLARSLGAAHVAVLHRVSDLRAAGSAGSEQRQLAEGLLADAETRVVFAQPPSEAGDAGTLLGLSGAEQSVLGHLPRGTAIWKIGSATTLVRHRPGPTEWPIIDTDAAMALDGRSGA